MKRKVRPGIWLTALGIALAGCASAAPAPSPTATPTVTATVPSTPAHAPTPTPTAEPGDTAIPPTESATPTFEVTPASLLSGDDFFLLDELLFGGTRPYCLLPCWNGLEPGRSSKSEVAMIFQEVLGLPPTASPSSNEALDILNYTLINPAYGENGSFMIISAWYETNSEELVGLVFEWGGNPDYADFKVQMSPQSLLQELGPPSHVFVEFDELISNSAIFRLMLVYDSGVGYDYGMEVDMQNNNSKACIGSEVPLTVFPAFHGMLLTEPIEDLEHLTPFQDIYIGEPIQGTNTGVPLIPIEERFGITPEELTQMANQDSNFCFSLY